MYAKGGIYMINQAILIGRIVREPELRKTDSGKNVTNITLAVPRSFKNNNGEYDTDFISCVVWRGVAENAVEYCKKGDLVSVRGRIQTRIAEIDEDTKRQYVEVVADRVSILSGKKPEVAE